MNLSTLRRPKTPYPRKRVGRGAGSGKGTTAARGTKGQHARTGGGGGLALMGLKNTIIKLPKLGGFTSRHPKMQPVNVGTINEGFKENEMVDARSLYKLGMISNVSGKIKILGQGKLSKKLRFKVHAVSETAKKAIEDSGSTVVLIVKEKILPIHHAK